MELQHAMFGGVSSGTVRRPPGSVPGRTILSALMLSSVHLAFESCSTFRFSRFIPLLYRLPQPLFHPLLPCRSWGIRSLPLPPPPSPSDSSAEEDGLESLVAESRIRWFLPENDRDKRFPVSGELKWKTGLWRGEQWRS